MTLLFGDAVAEQREVLVTPSDTGDDVRVPV